MLNIPPPYPFKAVFSEKVQWVTTASLFSALCIPPPELNCIEVLFLEKIQWETSGFPLPLYIPPPWARPGPASLSEKLHWVMTGLPPSFSIPPA